MSGDWEKWGLTDTQMRAITDCIDIIQALPREERSDVCLAIKFNGTFCFDCGWAHCDGVCQARL